MTDKEFTKWINDMFTSEAEMLEKHALERPLTNEDISWLECDPEENWKLLQKRIRERIAKEPPNR